MLNNEETIIGIPSEPSLRDEVGPILNEALELTEATPGVYKSPFLDVRFVEGRIQDLIYWIKANLIKAAMITDDFGLENGDDPDYILPVTSNYGPRLKPEWASTRLARKFSLKSDNPPKLAFLAKEEEADGFQDPQLSLFNAQVITKYPRLVEKILKKKFKRARNSVEEIAGEDKKFPEVITPIGEVTPYMRNGIIPNPCLVFDQIRTESIAEKYSLKPIEFLPDWKQIVAWPGFWTRRSIMKGKGYKNPRPGRENVNNGWPKLVDPMKNMARNYKVPIYPQVESNPDEEVNVNILMYKLIERLKKVIDLDIA